MIDAYHRGLYHFVSSGAVGLLAWLLICWISSSSSSTGHAGSTGSTWRWHWRIPLLLAVWTHIVADVVEHGNLPRLASGVMELFRALSGLL
jgi:hypothetical protein